MVFERIRNIRKDRDLMQKQIAEYLCISQYETGVIALSAENTAKLAIFYNTIKRPYKRK